MTLLLRRLMVGQRILTPSILVRVQAKQPFEQPKLKCRLFFYILFIQALIFFMSGIFVFLTILRLIFLAF